MYLPTVPADTVFGCSCPCTVITRSAFASSVVHGANDYPFRGTATHCLLHVTVGWIVPNYPSSVSLLSHDSAWLVKINMCNTGIHKFAFVYKMNWTVTKKHNVLFKHYDTEVNQIYLCSPLNISLMAHWIIALYVLLSNGTMQFVQLALITIMLHIKIWGELCGHSVHF